MDIFIYCNVYINFDLFLIYRSLSVGSKAGYRIFSVNSIDFLENIYENGEFI